MKFPKLRGEIGRDLFRGSLIASGLWIGSRVSGDASLPWQYKLMLIPIAVWMVGFWVRWIYEQYPPTYVSERMFP